MASFNITNVVELGSIFSRCTVSEHDDSCIFLELPQQFYLNAVHSIPALWHEHRGSEIFDSLT